MEMRAWDTQEIFYNINYRDTVVRVVKHYLNKSRYNLMAGPFLLIRETKESNN